MRYDESGMQSLKECVCKIAIPLMPYSRVISGVVGCLTHLAS
jgi:hypothetical protein